MSGGLEPKPYIAHISDIRKGLATDIYFLRAKEILEKTSSSGKNVVAEAHCYSLPDEWGWAVLTGIEEIAWLLEGKEINVYALDEGTIFRPMEPILAIEGRYSEFGIYESSLLGILRHYSSISTKAARIKHVAGDKTVLFFGIRCVHPVIAPMVDRAAYIGGCDAVSGVIGAEKLGMNPVGTMPHALILTIGNPVEAWKAFDEIMPDNVPRIMLCDTLMDERIEVAMAAEALGSRLHGVRLDTPSSRRGDMRKIVQEVRWTLDLLGRKDVRIIVSGGIDERHIEELKDIVDGFGVGTSIAFPKSIDISLDIVEVEGKPFSKRGKLPGRKQIYRCKKMHDTIISFSKEINSCPICGEDVEPLLKPLLEKGKLVRSLPNSREIREKVIKQLEEMRRNNAYHLSPIFA